MRPEVATSILFLLRRAPYRSQHAGEAIESALVSAVFDQKVSVLFKDDGVWQLVTGQQAKNQGRKSVGKLLASLPEYDVHDFYVCARSLAERNLDTTSLVLPVKELDALSQGELLARQNVVMND